MLCKGYKKVMGDCLDNARVLKEGIEKTGLFNIVSKDDGVPLVAFSLKDSSKYNVYRISQSLRRFGWIVPAYTMPPDVEHIAVLRVVIRDDFSRALADRLISDIEKVMKEMETHLIRVSTKTAHVTATVDETQDGDDGGKKHIKKSARETPEEIATYWRQLVARKKTGVC